MALTSEFYKGDRSMRESGFDVSFRFGPFGAGDASLRARVSQQSAVVAKTEEDYGEDGRSSWQGRRSPALEKESPRRKTTDREISVGQQPAVFFDYDFTTHKRSSYNEYASTFYPLWAGLASKEQAHEQCSKNLAHC